MLIGGQRKSGMKTNTVEVYNWQTNTACDSEALPYNISGMVGTLINGAHIFCGGETTLVQSKCYTLLDNFSWMEVSYMIF